MRTFLIILACLFAVPFTAMAQVPRHVVAEHFTNTRCGVCAFKNPDYYANLAAHPEVLNLAVHPSSPYNTCVLNQHNPSENDARTNLYGIFGATPRLVIQGEVAAPSVQFGSPGLFNAYIGQTSPFELRIKEVRDPQADSISVEVWLYTRETTPMTEGRLFIAYLEDTVFYEAPNGENVHLGVFRESLTATEGDLISIPATGDSLLVRRQVLPRIEWDMNYMQAMAMLTNMESLEVLQAAQTSEIVTEASTTSRQVTTTPRLRYFPNPAHHQLRIEQAQGPVTLFDAQGRAVRSWNLSGSATLDLGSLPQGLYWLRHAGHSYPLQRL